MSDLISRKKVIDILEKENSLRCSYDVDIAIFSIEKRIRELPAPYSVENVVAELEENASRYTKKYTTPYGNNGYKDTKAISIHKAIEIVKQGGVSDDVCEWKSTQINNEWKPSCEPNSTYNVFGVAWFKRCPYCGKKIKVVE